MLDNPIIQNVLSVALYLLRIAVPLLSIVVVCRCFHSLKAGRRREEPVVILQDMVTKEILPVLYWETVSYTHLDVYKRQVYPVIEISTRSFFFRLVILDLKTPLSMRR